MLLTKTFGVCSKALGTVKITNGCLLKVILAPTHESLLIRNTA